MDTPSAREFLSKSKLAGLLRQLLSYGVKLPDLSSLAPVSNATAAVLLDITKSTSAQFSLQLSGLRAFGEADVEQTCIISHDIEFALHCYCQADRADQKPGYQFWLNALGPNVHVNGRKVEMTNSLINIMPSSVSLIQTSSRKLGFYLFIQLHEVYWPPIDRNITWDQHFFAMGVDKLPRVNVPESFKQVRRVNQWMDEIEYPLCDPDEPPHRQHNDPLTGGVENRSTITGPPQARFSEKVPLVEGAPNPRQQSSIPQAATASRSMRISSGRDNPGGAKNLLGHRRSSRLQENILLKSQNMK